MSRTVDADTPFGANGPFFRIIKEGLDGLVDGDDYFDLLADEVVFEYVISVPGYPKRVAGRQSVIDLYSDYGDYMTMRSADNLRVYRDREASVVVLEYEVHGASVQTGRPYDNRFVSIATIENRKVTHWRDHLDPVAVFDASGWPQVSRREPRNRRLAEPR
jgi:ketosteroid isomerase-like protein